MAAKATGEFSFKAVTITYSEGPTGGPAGLIRQVNLEGTVTGFGRTRATAIFNGGPKGGSYSVCGSGLLDDGDVLSALGRGTYESVGKHRLRTRGVTEFSDGKRVSAEGEVDIVEQTWKGTFSELS